MKHKIYEDHSVAKLLSEYRKDRFMFELKTSKVDQFQSMMVHLKICDSIIENGLNTIEVNREDFSSQVSRDTIKKMKLSDIKFFISASSVNLSDDTFFYSKQDDRFSVSQFDSQGGMRSIVIMLDDNTSTIQDVIDQYNITYEDLLLDFISVILYFSVYHEDKSRVYRKVVKQKKNKQRFIDSGLVRVIKLKTPTKESVTYTESERKINKLFIVRGHWRNQPIKDGSKLIWIDPFWKGQGSEKIQKVYKG
jgi:hypothetical protein